MTYDANAKVRELFRLGTGARGMPDPHDVVAALDEAYDRAIEDAAALVEEDWRARAKTSAVILGVGNVEDIPSPMAERIRALRRTK